MNIAICFFGILYGNGGRVGSFKDFRHCYPNLHRNIIRPLEDEGHNVSNYFSTYRITDAEVEEEIYNLTNPKDVVYSDYNGSNAFTTKKTSFTLFKRIKTDVCILCRSDMHFNKPLKENVYLDKFNFLFPEAETWALHKFTTDNFYIWPHTLTDIVEKSFNESFGAFRPLSMAQDTHGVYKKILQYIKPEQINFISDKEEYSDVNSFYSICRTELPNRNELLNNEVMERFYK